MAYNNYMFPVGYQPTYFPQTPTLNAQQNPQQQQNTSNGIQWVQGEAAAKSFFVPAGQNVLLMDSESSCFYIKSTDNAGMPLPLRIFDYTERKQETNAIFQNSENNAQTEFIAREEFEKKFGEIETELRKLKTMTKEKKNVKSSV